MFLLGMLLGGGITRPPAAPTPPATPPVATQPVQAASGTTGSSGTSSNGTSSGNTPSGNGSSGRASLGGASSGSASSDGALPNGGSTTAPTTRSPSPADAAGASIRSGGHESVLTPAATPTPIDAPAVRMDFGTAEVAPDSENRACAVAALTRVRAEGTLLQIGRTEESPHAAAHRIAGADAAGGYGAIEILRGRSAPVGGVLDHAA